MKLHEVYESEINVQSIPSIHATIYRFYRFHHIAKCETCTVGQHLKPMIYVPYFAYQEVRNCHSNQHIIHLKKDY